MNILVCSHFSPCRSASASVSLQKPLAAANTAECSRTVDSLSAFFEPSIYDFCIIYSIWVPTYAVVSKHLPSLFGPTCPPSP